MMDPPVFSVYIYMIFIIATIWCLFYVFDIVIHLLYSNYKIETWMHKIRTLKEKKHVTTELSEIQWDIKVTVVYPWWNLYIRSRLMSGSVDAQIKMRKIEWTHCSSFVLHVSFQISFSWDVQLMCNRNNIDGLVLQTFGLICICCLF